MNIFYLFIVTSVCVANSLFSVSVCLLWLSLVSLRDCQYVTENVTTHCISVCAITGIRLVDDKILSISSIGLSFIDDITYATYVCVTILCRLSLWLSVLVRDCYYVTTV